MDYHIDLFEPEKDPLDPFGTWLASQNLYICKKLTPTFPATPEGDLAALKECLTQYVLRAYTQDSAELKSQIKGDLVHYEEKAIDAWLVLTSARRQDRTKYTWLNLEIGQHTFTFHFFIPEGDGKMDYWEFSCYPTIKL
jgi:hypothetical protein